MRSLANVRTMLIAGGAVLAMAASLPHPAAAGAVPMVLGTVDCEPTTGEQLITWNWTNSASEAVNFDSGVADGSALTAGSLVSDVVGMQPDTGLVVQGLAQGETIASADAVGTVSVTLMWVRTTALTTLQVVGSVLLFGDCALPETTVLPETTAVTTTVTPTVVATAPRTTSAVGSGGGRIPRTGSDHTLLSLGAGFIVVGVALLVVRRRDRMADTSQLH